MSDSGELVQGVRRSELRKVRTIVSLIGKENLYLLPSSGYQCIGALHIYASKNEEGEVALSIWNEPKESQSSRCLFADKIRIPTFLAALSYWGFR